LPVYCCLLLTTAFTSVRISYNTNAARLKFVEQNVMVNCVESFLEMKVNSHNGLVIVKVFINNVNNINKREVKVI